MLYLKAINPKTLKTIFKTLKIIWKNAPKIIAATDGIRRLNNNFKKDSAKVKLLDGKKAPVFQEYEQKKIEWCVKALEQHVRLISENRSIASKQAQSIGEIIVQNENVVNFVGDNSRSIKILIWSTGISFMIAIIAVLIALFK